MTSQARLTAQDTSFRLYLLGDAVVGPFYLLALASPEHARTLFARDEVHLQGFREHGLTSVLFSRADLLMFGII